MASSQTPSPIRSLSSSQAFAILIGLTLYGLTSPDVTADPVIGDVSLSSERPRIQYSLTQEKPLIEYERRMTNAPGSGPKLSLYADGRLEVVFPPFLKKAGQYETRLLPGEAERLLENLLRGPLTERPTQENQPPSPTSTASSTSKILSPGGSVSWIQIRLDGFAADSRSPLRPLDRQWKVRSLRYVDVEALSPYQAHWQEARQKLEDLLYDPRLSLQTDGENP